MREAADVREREREAAAAVRERAADAREAAERERAADAREADAREADAREVAERERAVTADAALELRRRRRVGRGTAAAAAVREVLELRRRRRGAAVRVRAMARGMSCSSLWIFFVGRVAVLNAPVVRPSRPSAPPARPPAMHMHMHPSATALLARPSVPQLTPEWFAARDGLLTASIAAAALDIKPFASFSGSARAAALKRKLDNSPVVGEALRHGTEYESEARDAMASGMGETVFEVGLIVHATEPWLAASPDGVTASGRLVEIKCPLRREIEPGVVPAHYMPQLQVQMEVCDVDFTLFVEYKPGCLTPDGLPVLSVVCVARDRAWFRDNVAALRAFWGEYDRRRRTHVPAPPAPVDTPALRAALYDDMYGCDPGVGDEVDGGIKRLRGCAPATR